MLTYIIYHKSLAIKTFHDADEMRDEILDIIEISYLEDAYANNVSEQQFRERMDILRSMDNLSFWRMVRENFGYYYKTY